MEAGRRRHRRSDAADGLVIRGDAAPLRCQRGCGAGSSSARPARCRRAPCSQSWRWTLGRICVAYITYRDGHPLLRPGATADRVNRLATSPRLAHPLGTNGFFRVPSRTPGTPGLWLGVVGVGGRTLNRRQGQHRHAGSPCARRRCCVVGAAGRYRRSCPAACWAARAWLSRACASRRSARLSANAAGAYPRILDTGLCGRGQRN